MTLTRRDLLASFLGVAAATAACRRTTRPAIPPGEYFGASADFGHRLRSAQSTGPNGATQRHRVIIVGGGVAGLSAAWRLRRRGIDDFVVLELESDVGGTARGGVSRAARHPWGAHYVPIPPPHHRDLIALLDEMDLLESIGADGRPVVREEHLVRDPHERLFYRGRWYEGLYLHAGASPRDDEQHARFLREMLAWSQWRDAKGRAAFIIPMALGSDDAEVTALDRITMAEWMRTRGFDSTRLLWMVDYSCRDDYGTTLGQTSAWAGIFYFASRMDARGEEAPLMSWPEGNQRFVDHFRRAIGARSMKERLVTRVTNEGEAIRVDTTTRGGEVEHHVADCVIVAAPQFIASRIVEGFDRDISSFSYGAWLVANLELTARPRESSFPLAWDNVLYESPSLGYVTATHQALVDYGPTVLTYYYALADDDPRVARKRLLDASREAWADVVLTDLERAHGDLRALTSRLDVARWGHAMIQPRPGFVWGAQRQKAAEPVGNIFFAHSDLSGLALFEEAFDRGLRAADSVAARLA